MKSDSKFANLLSAGGSLLSKGQLSRRLRLPGGKKAASTAQLSPLEPTGNETEPRRRAKRIRDLTGLNLVIEKIVHHSRADQKTKQA